MMDDMKDLRQIDVFKSYCRCSIVTNRFIKINSFPLSGHDLTNSDDNNLKTYLTSPYSPVQHAQSTSGTNAKPPYT